jgi:8-hydroxy-5-deazaflavin:NADPH oxidoreductase
MKIGTFGTGNMARVVAGRWAEAGHEVFFGSRDPEKAKDVAKEIGFGAQGGTNEEAALFGDVLLHTVRLAPSSFLRLSEDALDGKIIIDINNHDFPRSDPVKDLANLSMAETVQVAYPKSRVVKALNTMAQKVFYLDPADLKIHGVSAFLAGNDDAAVHTVAELCTTLGLIPVVMGKLDLAWLIEAQGDFIRTLIFKDLDPMMVISTKSIPKAKAEKFGGRK